MNIMKTYDSYVYPVLIGCMILAIVNTIASHTNLHLDRTLYLVEVVTSSSSSPTVKVKQVHIYDNGGQSYPSPTTTTSSSRRRRTRSAVSASKASRRNSSTPLSPTKAVAQQTTSNTSRTTTINRNMTLIYTGCCWDGSGHENKSSTNHHHHNNWNHGTSRLLINEMKNLRMVGIESKWVRMPCSRSTKKPDINSKEFQQYVLKIQKEAYQKDNIIISPHDRRYDRKFCQPSEQNNVWVNYALLLPNDDNNTNEYETTTTTTTTTTTPQKVKIRHQRRTTSTSMALQHKTYMNRIFREVGVGDHIPTQHSYQNLTRILHQLSSTTPTRSSSSNNNNNDDVLGEESIKFPLMVKSNQGTWGLATHILYNLEDLIEFTQNSSIFIPADKLSLHGYNTTTTSFYFEEALIGNTEYVIHYMRRRHHTLATDEDEDDSNNNNGNDSISFWCGEYRRPSDLFVQGYQSKSGFLFKIECDPIAIKALQKVIISQKVFGVGCVDGKYGSSDGRGRKILKFYDWNLRQCGSADSRILSSLYHDLLTKELDL